MLGSSPLRRRAPPVAASDVKCADAAPDSAAPSTGAAVATEGRAAPWSVSIRLWQLLSSSSSSDTFRHEACVSEHVDPGSK